MNVFLHQFDRQVASYSSYIKYARYADDLLFAIKPGYPDTSNTLQSNIQEVISQLKLVAPISVLPRGENRPFLTLGI